ncbi:MAG: 16S rRNA (uracil(1498)-N(3))-methyltransferase [Firmicutes bacterium]|nr:16S rRNA (uracil(1498)-N(3))-methyltransferase [Bacillota bacterium]
MPKHFANISGEKIYPTNETLHHLTKVLRVRADEQIIFCDGNETDYICKIISSNPFKVDILRKVPTETESSHKITLYQAITKADKLEWIIQKSVELGVCEIIPVNTKYSIKKNCNIERFAKIAESAAGQSMRGIIPKISQSLDWEIATQHAKNYDITIIAHEKEESQTIKNILTEQHKKIAVWIGSEGGFASEEISAAQKLGFCAVTLGKRILRAETASIVAISQINMLLEN